MMKRKYIAGIGALLMLTACQQSDGIKPKDNQIRFSAAYPGETSTRVYNNSFENGDVMGVYMTEYVDDQPSLLQMSGNFINNVRTVFNGSDWQCDPAMYWEDGKYDVYAYYPYDSEPSSVDEFKFNVELDQSENKGYENSDFLWAKATGVEKTDIIPLTFSHCMSKLVVKLVPGVEYEGELPSDASVYIHNTVPSALVDLSAGVATKNSRSSEKTIKAWKEADDIYTAIVVPQRIQNHIPLIEIVTKDVSYLVESAFIFRQGVQHEVSVTLSSNPDQVRIDIGGEISNWN